MNIKNDERIVLSLRSMYEKYGYARFKMSKFEEYELYARNKDFLVSDSIISFTDKNGRLMALKPDVTLSIVKNTRDLPGCVQKLCYHENVYRVARGANSFREIVQLGLECIGDVDDYSILEVLHLALESLKRISASCVLNISHLGLIDELLSGVDGSARRAILGCIRDKSAHELLNACRNAGVEDRAELLGRLIAVHGAPGEALPALEALLGSTPALRQLRALCAAFSPEDERLLRIDFSVVNDVNYYNGVVFRGYVEGIPQGVLSGGQYDRLMDKMGRRSRAIGFALYMDLLERLKEPAGAYDVDMLILYDADADLGGLMRAVARFSDEGERVVAQRSRPEGLRCRRCARYRNGEVEILEDA